MPAGAEEVEEEEETRIGESLFCLFGRRGGEEEGPGRVKRGEGMLSPNHGTGKNHNQDINFFT